MTDDEPTDAADDDAPTFTTAVGHVVDPVAVQRERVERRVNEEPPPTRRPTP